MEDIYPVLLCPTVLFVSEMMDRDTLHRIRHKSYLSLGIWNTEK